VAGDWIKVEKSSPNKPEVMRLARLWGVHQDQAFGSLIRFWLWLDDACVDGVVDGVASHEIDDMMRFPGFAMGIVAVGWLEIDDVKPCIRIPNFGKHNSESAKKRALTSERQSRWRQKTVDASVDAQPSTREEKRREDIKPKSRASALADARPAKPPANGTRLDPLWTLPAEWLEWAQGERPDQTSLAIERVALVFRDHWHGKAGKEARKTDWFATWRNWVRNERRQYAAPRDPTLAERRAKNMDILTGRARDERTVEGVAERVGKPALLAIPGDLREPGGDDVGGCRPRRGAAGVG